MESDMYSMAQHAVAKGYGKIEYLRAQPIALSSRVSTTASPSSACSPEVARRGFGGWMRLATSTVVYPVTCGLSKPVCNRQGRGLAGRGPWVRLRGGGHLLAFGGTLGRTSPARL